MGVADRLIHEFKAEDVEATGNRMVDALTDDVPENVSFFALLRAMGDPKVRRALYRSMNLLKAIGDQA